MMDGGDHLSESFALFFLVKDLELEKFCPFYLSLYLCSHPRSPCHYLTTNVLL